MKDHHEYSPTYGQYCPLAMATELLCNRWTMLIIREMLFGSTGFNEIHRGVPLMSRALLSRRLKELQSYGIIRRGSDRGGRRQDYLLTEAGEALGNVVTGMAEWGQTWIDVDPALIDIDINFLMWDVRRAATWSDDLPAHFVVQFCFPDAVEGKQLHWLVFDRHSIDVCYIDPGLEASVYLEASLPDFVRVWMGWMELEEAVSSGTLILEGPDRITRHARKWLGLSILAGIKKAHKSVRVLRTGDVV